MRYYLGIDGGGTKTTCGVGDETHLLATATAGPSNIVRVGEAQARESLMQAVRQACAAASVNPAQISRTCVGGAGTSRPECASFVQQVLAEILPTPIDVVGDMQIALEAAFDRGPGVVVNSGTGSFAYGRDVQGETLRAGGWGFEIGDEGSAHWIGRTAISTVLRASDRDRNRDQVAPSPLAKALCKAWGVSSLSDLARAANSIPPPDFAALFRAVVGSESDLSNQVLNRAGRELADLAAVVIRGLFRDENASVPVAMIGGVFRHAPLVREAFYNELRKLSPHAQVMPQLVDPVEGALRMAARQRGREGRFCE